MTNYDPVGLAFPFAVHAAMVEVEEETGRVKILKYLVCHDCGPLINPMIVEGEVVGGAIQGISGSLLEELPYTDDGNPLATSFLDYLVASAIDVPHVDVMHTETPSPFNKLGVKGAGEGGAIAPMATLASAVSDALDARDIASSAPIGSSLSLQNVWEKFRK